MMNQEELDALMQEINEAKETEKPNKKKNQQSTDNEALEEFDQNNNEENFEDLSLDQIELQDNVNQAALNNAQDVSEFLNTPVENQHKVIFQLDEVARDSEMKANEVFEGLECIQDTAMTLNNGLEQIHQYMQSQQSIFEKLITKFPNVQIFKEALNDTNTNLTLVTTLKDNIANCDIHINDAINAMQFQDIHQQKLNRVIHIIQSLVQYMNSLFESKDKKTSRAQPARHIFGDEKDDIISQDEIENLINSLGKK